MIAGRLALTVSLLLASAHASLAQTARFHVGIDIGTQARASSYSDAFDAPLYLENEHVTTGYNGAGGLFAAFSARYRLWKQMTAGVVVSAFSDTADATVEASLPHPFFDNTPRSIEGTANTKRQELSVSPTVGWILPLSSSVQLAVNGGPAVMTVKQQFVTGVKYSEAYPFDTATFTSADLTESSKTAVGVYAGADVDWMFSKHVGAGGVVQFTHATVKEHVGDRTVSIDVGGAQAGGGIRFVF
jgi:hypothetical protein